MLEKTDKHPCVDLTTVTAHAEGMNVVTSAVIAFYCIYNIVFSTRELQCQMCKHLVKQIIRPFVINKSKLDLIKQFDLPMQMCYEGEFIPE